MDFKKKDKLMLKKDNFCLINEKVKGFLDCFKLL